MRTFSSSFFKVILCVMTLTSSYFMLVHKMRGVGAIKTPIHFRRSTGVLAAKFKGVISELGGKKKSI